jgi:hypothetical protein
MYDFDPIFYYIVPVLSALNKHFSRIFDTGYFLENGFLSKMSTVDDIFVLNSLINHVLNQGKQLFFDFSKAFDYVVRENLGYKLIKLGLRSSI